jgi:penicillin-binding protein 1A
MASNYSKYSPTAIINTPPEQRRHLLARLWLPTVLLLSLAAGGLTGIIAAYELNYSRAANEVAALATYRPSVVTRVYADDGETVIGEFALEKRIPLRYEEIPPVLRNAILAVEDVRFYDHIGIDPIRIMGAGLEESHDGQGRRRINSHATVNQEPVSFKRTNVHTQSKRVDSCTPESSGITPRTRSWSCTQTTCFLGANAYGMEAGR